MNSILEKYRNYLKHYNDQIDRIKYSSHKDDMIREYTYLLDKASLVEVVIRDLEQINEHQEKLYREYFRGFDE
ncbi:hypothetical protein [Pseudoalteromonas phage PH357]|nr:hypothetical protein [Pseudoalteromonas phage PH357]